ncbi:MAG: NADAR family protein [Chlamydiota bacterium]
MTSMTVSLCKQCNLKPRYFDSNKGISTDFCSRKCKAESDRVAAAARELLEAMRCEHCRVKARSQVGLTGTYRAYCHIDCERAAKAAKVGQEAFSSSSSQQSSSTSSSSTTTKQNSSSSAQQGSSSSSSTTTKQTSLSSQQGDPKQIEYLKKLATTGVIEFYKSETNPQTAFLGNFSECSIGPFGCSEALYQAAKYMDPRGSISDWGNRRIFEKFSEYLDKSKGQGKELDKLGDAAWRTGYEASKDRRNYEVRSDWIGNNVTIMENILRLKYTRNPILQEYLLATGDAVLVERTDRDEFWGDGRNGQGKNMLGKLHMELRTELQKNGFITAPESMEKALLLRQEKTDEKKS